MQGLDKVRIAVSMGLRMDGPAAYLLGVRQISRLPGFAAHDGASPFPHPTRRSSLVGARQRFHASSKLRAVRSPSLR